MRTRMSNRRFEGLRSTKKNQGVNQGTLEFKSEVFFERPFWPLATRGWRHLWRPEPGRPSNHVFYDFRSSPCLTDEEAGSRFFNENCIRLTKYEDFRIRFTSDVHTSPEISRFSFKACLRGAYV